MTSTNSNARVGHLFDDQPVEWCYGGDSGPVAVPPVDDGHRPGRDVDQPGRGGQRQASLPIPERGPYMVVEPHDERVQVGRCP
jgi:hypothetical protein